MKKVIILFLASFALSIIGPGSIFAQDWPMFRGDLQHTGYSTSTAPSTNDVLWAYHIGDRVWSSPAVAEGKVFIGSGDGKIYCLSASDGSVIWSYQTGVGIDSSPAVADGKVFIGSSDGKVFIGGLGYVYCFASP